MTVGRETPTRSAISVLEAPSAASSRIRARCASTAGSWLDRAHRRSSARSSGAMGSGEAAGMRHRPTSHHTVKLLQRRTTRMCSVFLLENAMYKKEEMTAKEWLRPNLILVCGLPGSGKTTIARRLEQETGAIRLNIDEWVAALGVDFFDFEFRLRLESRLYEHGITLLKLGQSIILEDGLWTRDERDRHREIARKLGATTEIHYFNLPFDELWRRLEGRNAIGAQDTVPITKELLQECWRRFQRPDEAELALFTRAVVYRR